MINSEQDVLLEDIIVRVHSVHEVPIGGYKLGRLEGIVGKRADWFG